MVNPVPLNTELEPCVALDGKAVYATPAPPAPTVTVYVAPEYKVVDDVSKPPAPPPL